MNITAVTTKAKRRLALFIAIIMALTIWTAMPTQASAYTSEYFVYTVTDDKATIINFIDPTRNTTEIEIPDALGDWPVTNIEPGALNGAIPNLSATVNVLTTITVSENNPYFSSVDGVLFNKDKTMLIAYPPKKAGATYTIPGSVTSIGSYAFSKGTSLTSVTIPNSVTSIGEWAFFESDSLTSISIPSSVTKISKAAFWDCEFLETAVMQRGVTSIGDHAFFSCDALKSVTIPNSVTSIGTQAFSECSSLTSVTIPNGVTNIDGTFSGCKSLKTVTIPNSVTSIGWGAFSRCSSLATITIPNSVTNIDSHAFEECTSLKIITIPNSVTSIGSSAFSWCPSLTTVTIPNSVTNINSSAFFKCPSLTIRCYAKSYAETYAKNNDIPFTVITSSGGASGLNGWQKQSNGTWKYYVNGAAATGWKQVGASWYYLSAKGIMQTGWKKVGSSWYYLGSSGAMRVGWTKVGNSWYYLDAKGIMQSGWTKVGSSWYHLTESGAMQTGWQKISGSWYYFGGASDGKMRTGWQKISDSWYYFGGASDGKMKTGWQKIGGSWYYFGSASDGKMKTGRQMISGKSYSFDSSGVWIEDTALKLNQDAIRDIGKTYNQLKKEHPEYSNEMASPRITDGYDAGLRDPKTKRLFIFDSGQDWSPFSEGQHSILLNYLDYAGDKLKCEGVACTAGELFDGWVSDTITFDAFFKQLGLKENEYEYFDPTIEEYDMAWGALCFIYEGYWIEIDTTRGIQYDHTNPRKNVATSFVMKSDMVVLTEPSISNSNYDIKEAYEKSDHWKTVHSEEEALAALLKTIPDYPYKSLISYVEFEREAFPGGGYYIFMYPSAYSPNWSMRMAYVHVNGEVETF